MEQPKPESQQEKRPWQTPRLTLVGGLQELVGGANKSGPNIDGDQNAPGAPKRGQA